MEVSQKDVGLEQLKDWPPDLALKFKWLLMEHHHIFCLDKNEIGCTDATEDVIDWQIALPYWKKYEKIYRTCVTASKFSPPYQV